MLDLSGLPVGSNASWSTNPLTPDENALLTIDTSYTIITGTYPLTVTGSSDGIIHSVQALLVVEPAQLPVLDHCGPISSDEEWLAGYVHRVTCNVTVNSGITLTIQGGAIVKVLPAYAIIVYGYLSAPGTRENPIYITSYADDSMGGDTNGDGNASYPAPGDWGHITINGGSASFNYTTIRYGGYGSGASGSLSGINGADLALDHSTVSFSSDYGIELNGTSGSLNLSFSMVDNNIHGGVLSVYKAYNYFYSVSISDSSFNNNGSYALELYALRSPVITNNTFVGNQFVAKVGMTGGNLTTIGNSGSENTHNVIWISGSISEDTTFSSLSGLVYGLRNFTADALVTIDGGSIIKLVVPNTYNFNASLNILGTASKPVIFTSEKDDDIGGDSNGDGNASYPAPGDWGHITIDGGSASFNYTTIRYGGYGSGASGSLSGINGANLALDHGTVSFSSDYGIELNGTSGTLNLSYSMVDNNIHGGVLSVYKAYNYFYSVSISELFFQQ